MPFSRAEYETLLYTLTERYAEITASTLRLYSHSATTAFVRGVLQFQGDLELRVFEYLDLSDGEVLDYSYEVFRGGEKVRWYDPQPHPDDATLQSTYPHHYHEEPDIKHHRLPAPGISSAAPNLPTLIADCLKLSRQG